MAARRADHGDRKLAATQWPGKVYIHTNNILAGNEMRYEMKCPVRLAAPPP